MFYALYLTQYLTTKVTSFVLFYETNLSFPSPLIRLQNTKP